MDQFKAARSGDLQQLRVALTVGNVNDGDFDGWTALHYAARDGHDECVKFCIEMGASVNARTNDGWTPLHFASWERDTNVVRALLDAGAMVDATNDFGLTPLRCAIRFKRVDVTQLLMDRGAMVSNVKLSERVPEIPDWGQHIHCVAIQLSACFQHHHRDSQTPSYNNDWKQ
jgi:ankyrin repeat protein